MTARRRREGRVALDAHSGITGKCSVGAGCAGWYWGVRSWGQAGCCFALHSWNNVSGKCVGEDEGGKLVKDLALCVNGRAATSK